MVNRKVKNNVIKTLSLCKEVVEKIKSIAKEENRTLSSVVENAIKNL